jgi:hypothetical protein
VDESDAPARRGAAARMVGWTAVGLLATAAGLWALRPGRRPDAEVSRVVPASSPYKNTGAGVAYVGDEACARCHAEIAATFRQHPMGRSAAPATSVMPETTGRVFEVDDLTYSIERRDGRVFHRESRRDRSGREVASAEAEVRYAIGSGTRGISFAVAKGNGLFQSPLAWYAQERRWDLAPGYRDLNAHFDRPITPGCLFCHTNRFDRKEGREPVFHGLAIGCERCHGPGELHARRLGGTGGDVDLTIVNPADLAPPLREAVCEQCHLQSIDRIETPGRSAFDYRPGLAFDEFVSATVSAAPAGSARRQTSVGQVEQMRQSRCFQASEGRLGCISCHDPHRLPEPAERVAFYRDRCLACHEGEGCRLPRADRLARSPANDCIPCHMPRSPTADVAHTSQTLHRVSRPAGPSPDPRRAD